MFLVDTSVWIDFFNGLTTRHTEFLAHEGRKARLVTGDLIIVEVLQGFRREPDYQTAKKALLALDVREMVSVNVALKASEYYRILRRDGITIRKTVDCLIATYCIEANLPLLDNDADFRPFQRFGLLSPLK